MNQSPRKKVLLASSMLTILAGATIAPALPGISEAFWDVENKDALVALVLTAPSLAIALSAPLIGIAIDRYGRKPALFLAVCIYGIAGSSGLYLNSLYGLIAGRFALGLAVAAMMTATNALIADYYMGDERQSFIGAQSAAVGFSGVLFLTGGGYLADYSWRAPFTIYLAAFFLLPFIGKVLNEPEHAPKPVNAPGLVIGAGIKLRIAAAWFLAFALMVTFYILPVKLPFYLRAMGEFSATHTGFAISCGTLTMAIAALFYQRLRSQFSVYSLFAISFLIISLAFTLLAHASNYAAVLTATSINGIGSGIAMPNLNAWLADLSPAWARGKVFGGLTTAFFLGQFVSPIAIAPVIAQFGLGGPLGGFGAASICQLIIGLAFFALVIQRKWVEVCTS